ncbi:hypothetical protein Bca101_044444 [Brassica carinata]
MPTIAGSEKSKSRETPRKRNLRSAEANLSSENSIPTPKKLKSRRRITVSNLRTLEKEVKEDSNENLAVDNLSDCSVLKSNWNPRGLFATCGHIVCELHFTVKNNRYIQQVEPVKKDDCYSSPLQHLQSLFSQKQESSSRMMLIIADEMDFLITKDRGVLHDLFMLTTLPFSRCILIGVANAIDLADRFLPKLKSLNCKPMVITFRAYSKDQILRILQERLMILPYVAFQSNALELCARKVAAASGDMRKALSVCRSALEILEIEIRGYPGPESQGPTPDDPVVRIDHMSAALSKTFKSPVVDTIQSLPHHQQIIMCSAAKAFRGTKKDATVGELNKLYLEICKSWVISPAGITEFTNMCTVLNDQGILKFGQTRRDKVTRVSLRVDESDITFAVQELSSVRRTSSQRKTSCANNSRLSCEQG